mgnify:CR=1 FL=1
MPRPSPVFPRRSLLAVLLPALLVLAGCWSEDTPDADAVQRTTYADVRGRFLGTATDGRDIVVHHEAIPDLMGPMVMTLPLGDTAALQTIEKNDPIMFDLVITGSTPRVENIEALPDTVTLDLDAPADTTDPAGER